MRKLFNFILTLGLLTNFLPAFSLDNNTVDVLGGRKSELDDASRDEKKLEKKTKKEKTQ